MNKIYSPFLTYFCDQYGTREQAGGYDKRTDAELEKAIIIGEKARFILESRKKWDDLESASMRMWVAREKVKFFYRLDEWQHAANIFGSLRYFKDIIECNYKYANNKKICIGKFSSKIGIGWLKNFK